MTVDAFNGLVDAQADALFRFALSLTADEHDAEDAVQDAFERLWTRRHDVDPTKSKSYLFTTVHHRCIDLLRRRKPRTPLDPAHAVASDVPPHDVQALLHRALDGLSEVQRSVVLLRDYEGYSYQEIADITSLSLDQVRVYIFRARKALQTALGPIDALL
jgi:RNA polymerase sigma-70 factor (ECF subfamily)